MLAETIPARFFQQTRRLPDRAAYFEKRDGAWQPTSWAEYGRQVRQAGKALIALGLEPGGTVAILGANRPEWVIMDHAAMAVGGVPAGIYTTSAPEEIAFKVQHAESRVILVETVEQLERVRKVRKDCPKLEHVVLMRGGEPSDDSMSWEDFLGRGDDTKDSLFDQRLAGLQPDQLATLIYTSGTTGNPKAVMLSHHNIAWTASIAPQIVQLGPDDRNLSYLPLSHIAEQMFTIHCPATVGGAVYFAESHEKLPDNLKEVQPTLFFGVPRVWEKMHMKFSAGLENASPLRKKIVGWARSVASRVWALRMEAKEPGGALAWQYALANKLFTKVKTKRLGFGSTRFFVSGAAPLSAEVLEFFASVDIPILEVYGQSEDCGPTSFNRPGKARFGTVGPAIPGVKVKIAEDGEILVKGPNVFMGYYKNPEATAATLSDGWLHSGDLGRFDDDDFLLITGRKKDIIITAGGKNIAPKDIEAGVKMHPLVGECVLIGDRRPYCIALITLDPEAAEEYAQQHGVPVAKLPEHPALRNDIEKAIAKVNEAHAKVAGIKKFTILPRAFTVDDGELTPTMKIRRKNVEENFADAIEALYGGVPAKD